MKKRFPESLYQSLREIVGENYITSNPLATFAYSQDASVFGGTQACMVMRPGSTEEVSRTLFLANEYRIPVVIRGGGASNYGQPKGVPGENILLDMTRMNRVLNINQKIMTVTAQCGIIMGKLQHACRKEGLYLFSPFAPLHIVSLGGWISGVAGAAGLWRDIVGLTVVLPNGTVATIGGGPGTNIHQPLPFNRHLGGPDFTGLFIGDGGSFGIKTEATIRVTRFPSVMRASAFVFDTMEETLEMVGQHVERVDPHPFDPILVFCPEAMKNFLPNPEGKEIYTVMGMMQGHSVEEMDARLKAFNLIGEELGGGRDPSLNAMADAMAASSNPEGGAGGGEMDWLAFFNGFGLACWLPFNLPREGFVENYRKLVSWRNERLKQAERRGYQYTAKWEFFTPTDSSGIIGEIDVFFQDAQDPEVLQFVQTMMRDFQDYALHIGAINTYTQGIASNLHVNHWSSGFKDLFKTIKLALDPNNILNPDLWTGQD